MYLSVFMIEVYMLVKHVYRWFVSLLRYVSLLISPYSNRQLFISTVLNHWREHIRTLVDTVEGVTVGMWRAVA